MLTSDNIHRVGCVEDSPLNIGSSDPGDVADLLLQKAKAAIGILMKLPVPQVMSIEESEYPVAQLIIDIRNSKYQLTFEEFYLASTTIRDNFHVLFQNLQYNSLFITTEVPDTEFMTKFQIEHKELHVRLVNFFSDDKLRIGASDAKNWTPEIREDIYRAYCIMLSYPEVKSN